MAFVIFKSRESNEAWNEEKMSVLPFAGLTTNKNKAPDVSYSLIFSLYSLKKETNNQNMRSAKKLELHQQTEI